MEKVLYMRVVAMSADAAKQLVDVADDPVDLGPADPTRYREGARVWGFPRKPKNASERAAIKWGVEP